MTQASVKIRELAVRTRATTSYLDEGTPLPTGNHLMLDGVSWRTYVQILQAFDDRHLRLTYDRGMLEIMTLSPEHERMKHLLGYLIGVLVEELDGTWLASAR